MYGLILDEESILVAQQNLINEFIYSINNIQNTVKVEPNHFCPTYESMYSVLVDSIGSTKFNFGFTQNVATLTRVN